MLEVKMTPNRAGLAIWGDYESLRRLHSFVCRVTEESAYIESKEGFVMGLAYDLRKAYEGWRSKDTYACNETDYYKLYGVEVLLPLILVQSVMLRKAMAFMPTTKLDQAIMFEFEHAIESALRKAAPGVFDEIMSSMGSIEGAPYHHLDILLDGRCRYFIETLPRQRLPSLPKLLRTFDPSYEILVEMMSVSMPDAIPLSAFVNGRENDDWPDFKW